MALHDDSSFSDRNRGADVLTIVSSLTVSKPAHTSSRMFRRDPTGQVDLENPRAVGLAIRKILDGIYGETYDALLLDRGINDLVNAFCGYYPGLLHCDTLYHDLRHSLESGLTMARVLDGHAKSLPPGSSNEIDGQLALLGILLALFHDIGLLRRDTEADIWGPTLTPIHEERGVEFMSSYLSATSLQQSAEMARLIMSTKLIFRMPDTWSQLDKKLASMVATADLLSQLADRCYLEKCRDFLFIEFSAFGLAGKKDSPYPDRETLLEKTPGFFHGIIQERLDQEFQGVYRLLEVHCGGMNPWLEAIGRNLKYLERVLESRNFARLRRQPKPFVGVASDHPTPVR